MLIFVDGIWAHCQQHCKRLGISYSSVCLTKHANKGISMSLETAIEICVAKKNLRGRDETLKSLAEKHGMKYDTLHGRLIRWKGDLKRALETPVRVWRKKCQNV